MNSMPRTFMHFPVYLSLAWRACLAGLLLSVHLSVQAQTSSAVQLKGTPHDEVQKAMGQRKWPQALEQVDAY